MSYSLIKKLPPAETFIQEIPLRCEGYEKISRDRREIKKILSGEDSRLLLIVGPCSAWPTEPVIAFAQQLQRLNLACADVIKIVMRVYVQKPRSGLAWKGPVNQPDIFSPPNIEAGLRSVRQMMCEIIEIGLPIADESLFTHHAKAFSELLAWSAIGARSSEDQEHRILASSMDCPVGLKNPTHGALETAVNSVYVAQHPHVAAFEGYEVQTEGNPYAHLILRGANQQPNYSNAILEKAYHLMQDKSLAHPAVIIDASHDNSWFNGQKDYQRQPQVILDTLDAIQTSPHLKQFVKGFMMESFIKAGNQSIDPARPDLLDKGGLSVTDPCLDWDQTELFIQTLAQRRRR